MNRQERLKYCKVCTLQRFDAEKGIICSLTNQEAAFEVSCTMYKEDAELKFKAEMEDIRHQIHTEETSKGKRFANYIIDVIAMYIMAIFFMVAYTLFVGISDPAALEELANNNSLSYFIGALLTLFYYTLMEATTGRTIGKLITKTKVVDANGDKPDFGSAFIRSLCRCVPFEAFSFLFADKGWHDNWSNTRVVDVK